MSYANRQRLAKSTLSQSSSSPRLSTALVPDWLSDDPSCSLKYLPKLLPSQLPAPVLPLECSHNSMHPINRSIVHRTTQTRPVLPPANRLGLIEIDDNSIPTERRMQAGALRITMLVILKLDPPNEREDLFRSSQEPRLVVGHVILSHGEEQSLTRMPHVQRLVADLMACLC